MARSIVAVVALCAVAYICAPAAFVQAPRSSSVAPEVATVAAVATLPQAAGAFTFEGEEYFDIYFGIEPTAWALCGFIILTFAGFLKTSVAKYNVPVSKEPLKKKFVPLQQERPGNFVDQKISGFDTTF
mmetsp:Transcript_139464/g.197441  ORF Transcript_139464/g.197441 Transcript_139464/m.197441 type:complete len:129 (-) Transcript_139464:68-454(-)